VGRGAGAKARAAAEAEIVANALNDYLILLIRLIGVEISLVRLNADKMCFTI